MDCFFEKGVFTTIWYLEAHYIDYIYLIYCLYSHDIPHNLQYQTIDFLPIFFLYLHKLSLESSYTPPHLGKVPVSSLVIYS